MINPKECTVFEALHDGKKEIFGSFMAYNLKKIDDVHCSDNDDNKSVVSEIIANYMKFSLINSVERTGQQHFIQIILNIC